MHLRPLMFKDQDLKACVVTLERSMCDFDTTASPCVRKVELISARYFRLSVSVCDGTQNTELLSLSPSISLTQTHTRALARAYSPGDRNFQY